MSHSCRQCRFDLRCYTDQTIKFSDEEMPLQAPPKMLAGFWRRFFADVIDMLILAFVGLLLSFPLGSLFWRLGPHAPWVGLVITFLYAGLLQSSIGDGQTLGKRILGIQVLRLDGGYLSLPQSFLRYAMLAVVSYSGCLTAAIGALFPSIAESEKLSFAMTMFALTFFLGCTLLVVLHPLKRGLHDLLAGSIAVHKGTYDADKLNQLADPSRENRAVAIVVGAVFLCLSIGAFAITISDSSDDRERAGWSAARMELDKLGGVRSAGLGFRFVTGGGVTRRYLDINLVVDGPTLDDKAKTAQLTKQAAEMVVHAVPDSSEFDEVRVIVRASLHLGIFTAHKNVFERFDRTGKSLSRAKSP
jgi:uncharacterized RDD family membrane protein YckC